jgi:hypothetical protein
MTTLQILFYLGLLTTILKVADLLLLPSQQKWLQDKVDTFTLWISYQKPLIWCKRVLEKKITQILATVLFTAFCILFTISQLQDKGLEVVWIASLTVFSLTALTIIIVQLLKFKEIKVYTWLFKKGSIISFVLKLAIVSFLIYLYIFTIGENFDEVEYLKFASLIERFSVNVIHAFLTPAAVVIYSLVVLPSIGILFIYLVIVILWMIVQSLQFIMWRIALYPKGAWAGIIAILTCVCGIAIAYLDQN